LREGGREGGKEEERKGEEREREWMSEWMDELIITRIKNRKEIRDIQQVILLSFRFFAKFLL
jgi:hypothetical protein